MLLSLMLQLDYFFSIKKGSVQVGWDGDGSYIRFKNDVLRSYACTFSIFAVVPISSSLV